MIKFSIETLYHFNCGNCKKWWSVGDWKPTVFLSCPHCNVIDRVDEKGLSNVSFETQTRGTK